MAARSLLLLAWTATASSKEPQNGKDASARQLSLFGSTSRPISGYLFNLGQGISCLEMQSDDGEFQNSACTTMTLDADGVLWWSNTKCLLGDTMNDPCPGNAASNTNLVHSFETGVFYYESSPRKCLWKRNGNLDNSRNDDCTTSMALMVWQSEMPGSPILQPSAGKCAGLPSSQKVEMVDVSSGGCEDWTLLHTYIHQKSDPRKCWENSGGEIKSKVCVFGNANKFFFDTSGRIRDKNNDCVYVHSSGQLMVTTCADNDDTQQLEVEGAMGILENAAMGKCIGPGPNRRGAMMTTGCTVWMKDTFNNFRLAVDIYNDLVCFAAEGLNTFVKYKDCQDDDTYDWWVLEGGAWKNFKDQGCMAYDPTGDAMKTLTCDAADPNQAFSFKSLSPSAAESPLPAPAPSPTPSASPSVSPAPEPSPEPSPTPSSMPVPEPSPTPSSSPALSPAPEPSPEPNSSPGLSPAPEPSLAPSLLPAPEPSQPLGAGPIPSSEPSPRSEPNPSSPSPSSSQPSPSPLPQGVPPSTAPSSSPGPLPDAPSPSPSSLFPSPSPLVVPNPVPAQSPQDAVPIPSPSPLSPGAAPSSAPSSSPAPDAQPASSPAQTPSSPNPFPAPVPTLSSQVAPGPSPGPSPPLPPNSSPRSESPAQSPATGQRPSPSQSQGAPPSLAPQPEPTPSSSPLAEAPATNDPAAGNSTPWGGELNVVVNCAGLDFDLLMSSDTFKADYIGAVESGIIAKMGATHPFRSADLSTSLLKAPLKTSAGQPGVVSETAFVPPSWLAAEAATIAALLQNSTEALGLGVLNNIGALPDIWAIKIAGAQLSTNVKIETAQDKKAEEAFLIQDLKEFRRMVDFHSSLLISEYLQTGIRNVTKQIQGGAQESISTIVALNASHGDVRVPLAGTGASVTMPMAVLLSSLSVDNMLLSATFVPQRPKIFSRHAGGWEVTPLSLMGLETFATGGASLAVRDLSECIVVAFPLRNLAGPLPTCGFFNEAKNHWEDLPGEVHSDELRCCTRHLSIFGAIAKGFAAAIMCSQLGLYTSSSMARLLEGHWYNSGSAWLVYSLLAGLLLLQILAAVSDGRREGRWDDRVFLIPKQLDTDSTVETEEVEVEGLVAETARSAKSICIDILEELASKWLKWAKHVRNITEQICEAVAVQGHDDERQSCCVRVAHAILDSLVMKLTYSQAGWSLNLTEDMITMVMTDEDFGELVLQRGKAVSMKRATEGQLSHWRELHAKSVDLVDRTWRAQGLRRLPLAVWRLFLTSCPLTSIFLGDVAMSSKLRAMLLSAETAGASMVACVFFVSSGSATSALDPEKCTEPKDIWEELASITVVATFSLVLGALPVSMLSSLHSRTFVSIDFKGCPEWHRHLWKWRIRDRLLVVLSLLYIAFCILTILLFLANVAEEDLPEWSVTSAITFVEDMVLLPLILACIIPTFACGLLLVVSLTRGVQSKSLLIERKDKVESAEGNWVPHTSRAREYDI